MSDFWWQVAEQEQQQEAEMCSQTTGENEMSKPSTIRIDEVEYVRADSVKPTKKQIVVLQRGWVVIGDVEKTADEVKINNCAVIRVWGTENGLGELAEKGKMTNTKLDPCPALTVHPLSVVLYMNVNESRW